MFLVGYELDLRSLRGRTKAVLAISASSVVVPFVAGAVLALSIYRHFGTTTTGRTAFVLFIGVAMAITAFPVLARILVDHGMGRTGIGTLALACAAAQDTAAWCLLSVATAFADARGSLRSVALLVVLSAIFVTVMFGLVRPLWSRLADHIRVVPDRSLPVLMFAAICVCGLATTAIGINAIFGAFVLGATLPRGSVPLDTAVAELRGSFVPILLPLYFAVTGLSTDIGLLSSVTMWLWFVVALGTATAAKLGGTLLAARLTRHDWRTSLTLGVLMNCRGLTELIVLNTGRQLGILRPDLFTIFVLVALLTTAATGPLLSALGVRRRPAEAVPRRGEPRFRLVGADQGGGGPSAS